MTRGAFIPYHRPARPDAGVSRRPFQGRPGCGGGLPCRWGGCHCRRQDSRGGRGGGSHRAPSRRRGGDLRRHLIMAGFVDSHVHYPQIDIIASYGEQLLDWLKKYTFPAEAKFADREHAIGGQPLSRRVPAQRHHHRLGLLHRASGLGRRLLLGRAARGLRMAAGKVMMDRNAPDGLSDTARSRLRRVQGTDRALARRGPANLRRHAALCRHLVAGPAGGGRRAVARAPNDSDADALERERRRDRLGQGAAPRTARLPRHL